MTLKHIFLLLYILNSSQAVLSLRTLDRSLTLNSDFVNLRPYISFTIIASQKCTDTIDKKV